MNVSASPAAARSPAAWPLWPPAAGAVVLWARSDASAEKAARPDRQADRALRLGGRRRGRGHDRPRPARRARHLPRRGDRRGARRQGRADRAPRAAPGRGRDPREHDLVAVDRGPRRRRRLRRALRGPARLQPGHEDGPGRARLPRGGDRRRRASARSRSASSSARPRSRSPTCPGFVVNRLLFPFLFEAVRLREETGLEPAAVDSCLQLGAGHPMGPLALLDMIKEDLVAGALPSIATVIWSKILATMTHNQQLMEGILAMEEEHADDLVSLLEELGS